MTFTTDNQQPTNPMHISCNALYHRASLQSKATVVDSRWYTERLTLTRPLSACFWLKQQRQFRSSQILSHIINCSPELGWYPNKGRSNATDKVYLINLICIDSLGLYAKAQYLFEPRAMFPCPGTDQLKNKMCWNLEEITSSTPAAGKTDETGKIQPCSIVGGSWGCGISRSHLNSTDKARSVLRSVVAE